VSYSDKPNNKYAGQTSPLASKLVSESAGRGRLPVANFRLKFPSAADFAGNPATSRLSVDSQRPKL